MKKLFALFCAALVGCGSCDGGSEPEPVEAGPQPEPERDAAPADAAPVAFDADARDAARDASRDAEPTRDAEPARDAQPQQAGVRIGPAGGSFGNDVLNVTVPAGALSAELAFSVAPAPNGAPGARGGTWELAPSGTTFATPALLTFKAGQVASGVALAQLTIMTSSASGWQALEGVTRDEATQTVSAPLAHLSPYALVYVPPMPVSCPAGTCANGACVPGASDWTCQCNANFVYAPATKTCVDEPNCPTGACANGTCNDLPGNYSCSCAPGFDYDAASKTCVNHNDCSPSVCANGSCNDLVNDYSCTCAAGYDYDAASKTCVNHNDCQPTYCAGGVCMDLINDYVCASCPFEGSGTKSCDGQDDCVAVTCANGVCIDGNNDYTCSCNAGFDSTGKACIPHDDCPAGACANGTCIDQHLDYACQCNPGYDVQGKACVKHLYCAGNPCGVGGTCVEQTTSYTCSCMAPYTAQGGTCVNLCANVSCVGGTCNAGVCTCPSTHDLINGTCVLKDPCAGVNCGFNGTCDNGVCTCPSMYVDQFGVERSTNLALSADSKACQCARKPDQYIPGSLVYWADCDGLPETGCEDNLNSESHCGFCSRCNADQPFFPLQEVPGTTPRVLLHYAGMSYAYQVESPLCPAPIKRGEVCGHWSEINMKYGISWDFTNCVATETMPPRCVGRPSN